MLRVIRRSLFTTFGLGVVALAGLEGYRLLETAIEAEVYRSRLEEVAQDYEELRDHYNEAVRRTAVTELVVEEGKLQVAIRDVTGEIQRFDTPYDPSREIYVDYVVLDGRLWIRRVFDEDTPPGRGLVIDPGLADVDWSRDPDGHGKAAYRELSEGRWVVSVTGDGSLGLARAEDGTSADLMPAPPVRRYEPVESAVGDALRAVGPVEAVRALAVRLERRAEAALEPFVQGLLGVSIALLVSLAIGRGAARIGVPRVTAYLLVGLLLGPHVLLRLYDPDGIAGRLLLGPATEAPLQAVSQLAVGFILFGIGSEFRFAVFRRVGGKALAFSAGEVGVTGLLVGAAVWLGTGDWRLAVVAPALAVATAPSATLVTLREVEAEGPATRALMLSVGHNNLAALLSFPLLVALAFGGGGALPALALAAGALAAGAAIGLVGAVLLESIDGRRELVLLGILLVLASLGVAHWMSSRGAGLGMLACFAAGVALVNASPHAERVQRYVENTVYPLYVLFFIAAGRDLQIEALAAAGALGALFIAARSAGKLAGSRLGLRLAGWRQDLPVGFGAGLLCQAGVALGLVAALETIAPAASAPLRDVVVASVVFFELIGPWLVRRTVVRAGEVKLVNLVPHPEATGTEAVRWVALELLRNLGLLGGRPPEEGGGPTVEHAMRRRPDVLGEDLPFARVLKLLAETHADLLPVLDRQGRFKGVISYAEVKNVLYDPSLRDLVVAEDLTTPVAETLPPHASLAAALELMDRHQVHSWPVVQDGQLLGVLRRADAYALMRRGLGAGRRGGSKRRPAPSAQS